MNNTALPENVELIVAPAFPHLSISANSSFKLAAQDVSRFPSGAYTGEVNAQMLKNLGVSYCLVGHSERRRYLHETSTDIVAKISELQDVGITPVLCVDTDNYLEQISLLSLSQKENLLIAYEPLEAIGTGNPADPENVALIFHNIKEALAVNVPLLYGGSITAGEVTPFLKLESLAGFLVGSASLDAHDFAALLEDIANNA